MDPSRTERLVCDDCNQPLAPPLEDPQSVREKMWLCFQCAVYMAGDDIEITVGEEGVDLTDDGELIINLAETPDRRLLH